MLSSPELDNVDHSLHSVLDHTSPSPPKKPRVGSGTYTPLSQHASTSSHASFMSGSRPRPKATYGRKASSSRKTSNSFSSPFNSYRSFDKPFSSQTSQPDLSITPSPDLGRGAGPDRTSKLACLTATRKPALSDSDSLSPVCSASSDSLSEAEDNGMATGKGSATVKISVAQTIDSPRHEKRRAAKAVQEGAYIESSEEDSEEDRLTPPPSGVHASAGTGRSAKKRPLARPLARRSATAVKGLSSPPLPTPPSTNMSAFLAISKAQPVATPSGSSPCTSPAPPIPKSNYPGSQSLSRRRKARAQEEAEWKRSAFAAEDMLVWVFLEERKVELDREAMDVSSTGIDLPRGCWWPGRLGEDASSKGPLSASLFGRPPLGERRVVSLLEPSPTNLLTFKDDLGVVRFSSSTYKNDDSSPSQAMLDDAFEDALHQALEKDAEDNDGLPDATWLISSQGKAADPSQDLTCRRSPISDGDETASWQPYWNRPDPVLRIPGEAVLAQFSDNFYYPARINAFIPSTRPEHQKRKPAYCHKSGKLLRNQSACKAGIPRYQLTFCDDVDVVLPREGFHGPTEEKFGRVPLGSFAWSNENADEDQPPVPGERSPSPPPSEFLDSLPQPLDPSTMSSQPFRTRLRLLRPALQLILRDDYGPARTRTSSFFAGGQSRRLLAQHVSTGRWKHGEVKNEVLEELLVWALKGEGEKQTKKMLAWVAGQSENASAAGRSPPDFRQSPAGCLAYEGLSAAERNQFVVDVLLPETLTLLVMAEDGLREQAQADPAFGREELDEEFSCNGNGASFQAYLGGNLPDERKPPFYHPSPNEDVERRAYAVAERRLREEEPASEWIYRLMSARHARETNSSHQKAKTSGSVRTRTRNDIGRRFS